MTAVQSGLMSLVITGAVKKGINMTTRTKIFFDTEFTGLHQKTTLISIGLVAETGETFYAELNDYDHSQIDDWINENVIKKLQYKPKVPNPIIKREGRYRSMCANSEFVAKELSEWLDRFESVEMWSDCLAYDWVLFCGLYGHAFNIPKNVYYIPFDICTLFKIKGIDADVNREEYAKSILVTQCFQKGLQHNAIWDAMVIKACYEKLSNEK